MESRPATIKIKPVRAANGHVERPARIWLTPVETVLSEVPAADASLALDPEWLAEIKLGDRIRFKDARGSRRSWRIREVAADGCWAEAKKTAYVANGLVLCLHDGQDKPGLKTKIISLPPQESVCLVRKGDVLLMSSGEEAGTQASLRNAGLNNYRFALPTRGTRWKSCGVTRALICLTPT